MDWASYNMASVSERKYHERECSENQNSKRARGCNWPFSDPSFEVMPYSLGYKQWSRPAKVQQERISLPLDFDEESRVEECLDARHCGGSHIWKIHFAAYGMLKT